MSGNDAVGGYSRAAVAADVLRLNLNKVSRGESPLFTRRVFELLAAAARRSIVCGVRFHPEKSGARGARILANFLENAQ